MFRHSTMASIAFTIVLTGCLPPTEVVPLGNGPLGAGQGGQTGGQPGIGGPGAGEMGGGTPAGTAGTQQSGAAWPTGSAGTQQSGGASPTGSAGTVQMAGTTQVGAGGGGGDGSTLPVCSSVAEPPRNVGCVQPKGGWPTTTNIVGEATARFEGTITAIGKATATSGCLNSCGGYPPIDDFSRTVALTVAATTDAGAQEWNIEYEVPSTTLVWTVGQVVSVDYSRQFGDWTPPSSKLAVRSARGLELEISEAAEATALQSATAEFRQGSPVCHQEHQCGPWERYQVEARNPVTGEAGAWVAIPYDGSIILRAYRVASGLLARNLPLSGPDVCVDWYVATARVAVTRAQ